MKCIIGLGNPGKKYENTRHNVGFHVIDKLSDALNIPLTKEKFNGLYGTGFVDQEKVVLLKPLTYMNLSGEAVRPLLDFYKIELKDIIVVYDDLDLPSGKVRLRQKGSAGGQNGMKSIIQHLNSQEFNRIRIGIDRPQTAMSISDYVLGQLQGEEALQVKEAVTRAADACESWLKGQSFLDVMNRYNK